MNGFMKLEEKESLEDKYYVCPMCGEETPEDYQVDTDGLVNGSIGIVCQQCWDDRKC